MSSLLPLSLFLNPPLHFHLHPKGYTPLPLLLSLSRSRTSTFPIRATDSDREEIRWVREEQRWLREEQRWLREEQRWISERESLLRQIADLKLEIQALQNRNNFSEGVSVSNTIAHAGLLKVPKEKSLIAERGTVVEEKEQKQVESQGKKRKALRKGSQGEAVKAMQEGTNGAVVASMTEISELQKKVVSEEVVAEVEVSEQRVFLLGENRWEEPSRLASRDKQTVVTKPRDTITKCLSCHGEGRLMCTECNGTGEPNVEPQFLEWVEEGAKCAYCEGLGYTICDLCEGKTVV